MKHVNKIIQLSLFLVLYAGVSFAQYWNPFGFGTTGSIQTIIGDTSTGYLYAGGTFDFLGNGVHLVRHNTSIWDTTVNTGINDSVYALALYNGNLYAGGVFTTAGGTPANHIAMWDGTTWLPLSSGMDDVVEDLEVHNGELYATGRFTTAGGVSASRIAKWDGSAWSAVGSGFDETGLDILSANCVLYAAGMFITADGTTVNHITYWDGLTWQPMGSGADNTVRAIGIHENVIYIGGDFSTADAVAAEKIAKWNGTTFEALGSGIVGSVNRLQSYNCEIYVAGNFTLAGGNTVSNLARYSVIGGWNPVGNINITSSAMHSMAANNNALYVSGDIISTISTYGNIGRWTYPTPGNPVAQFTASETLIHYGRYIQFQNAGSSANSVQWSFPGGIPSTSTSQSPKIFYPAAGTFDVSLYSLNCVGTDTLVSTNIITVDSLEHSIPLGKSADFINIITPPGTGLTAGDYYIRYYKPALYDSLTSPILIFIPGGATLEDIQDVADHQNAMIVSPTMHTGWHFVTETLLDSATGCSKVFFQTEVLKQVYRHALARDQRTNVDAYLTGFSSGAQFVTRYLLIRQFDADSIPIRMAVSVSPENYAFMTDTFNGTPMPWEDFRCGLEGNETFVYNCAQTTVTPVSDFICPEHVIQYYNENYGVLVGTADIYAMQLTGFCAGQGLHRYDRASQFYNFSFGDAIARGTNLQWQYDSVPLVGYNSVLMFNTKENVTDSFTIAENLLFNTPFHTVPQLTPSCIPVGIEDALKNDPAVAVFPNPNKGEFIVRLDDDNDNPELLFMNLLGETIVKQKIRQGDNIISIPDVAEGIYVYRIYSDEKLIGQGKLSIVPGW